MSDAPVSKSELDLLKERADRMGIKYHPTIGTEALKKKINDALGVSESKEVTEDAEGQAESPSQRRTRLMKEARILRRVRITCMNPTKRSWRGEVFTAANRLVGTVKRFVPFDSEEGTHVEDIILKQIKLRQYRTSYVIKDSRGRDVRRNKLVKEFAIEELPPLTKEELADLAQRQAMSGAIDA